MTSSVEELRIDRSILLIFALLLKLKTTYSNIKSAFKKNLSQSKSIFTWIASIWQQGTNETSQHEQIRNKAYPKNMYQKHGNNKRKNVKTKLDQHILPHLVIKFRFIGAIYNSKTYFGFVVLVFPVGPNYSTYFASQYTDTMRNTRHNYKMVPSTLVKVLLLYGRQSRHDGTYKTTNSEITMYYVRPFVSCPSLVVWLFISFTGNVSRTVSVV